MPNAITYSLLNAEANDKFKGTKETGYLKSCCREYVKTVVFKKKKMNENSI